MHRNAALAKAQDCAARLLEVGGLLGRSRRSSSANPPMPKPRWPSLAALCGFDDFHRLRSQNASGIQNPVKRSATFEWLGGAEEGLRFAPAAAFQEHHAVDGQSTSVVRHALREATVQ